MMKQMDKGMVIGMKLSGKTNREINREKGYCREKIAEVWREYKDAQERMKELRRPPEKPAKISPSDNPKTGHGFLIM